jgi:hypothetical protein
VVFLAVSSVVLGSELGLCCVRVQRAEYMRDFSPKVKFEESYLYTPYHNHGGWEVGGALWRARFGLDIYPCSDYC